MTDASKRKEQLDLLQAEVEEHQVGSRTIQAALLAWFLESVWKLDPEDVPDAICDGPGDKGIDALYVDDDSAEITVFQSKWRKSPLTSNQGDSELKAFVGVAEYFQSDDTVRSLLASKPNDELRKLIVRQQVESKLANASYSVRLVFVTNGELDSSGSDYVAVREVLEPPLSVYAGSSLTEVAERTKRPAMRSEQVTLLATHEPIVENLTDSEKMAVTLVSAKELVKLPGIADQTLFSRNVRLAVGRTSVNNELKTTIKEIDEHRLFPAFHNGLTLLTDKLEVSGTELSLDGVGVVNGCQSLTALYNNSESLTDGLKLLVKVIQVPNSSRVSDKITYRSNNQNAVTLRDQRSNDKATLSLQREVSIAFGNAFYLKVKTGEQPPAGAVVMENTTAAQLIMAVYLGEPWAAVRKLRLFDQDFRRIFTQGLSAQKLYLLHLIDSSVTQAKGDLRPDLKASFAAIRFTLLFLVARVLELSPAGTELLETPQKWFKEGVAVDGVTDSLKTIAFEVVNSVNDYVELRLEEDENFDPKVAFKSQTGVSGARLQAVRDAKSQDRRGRSYYFAVSPA